MGSVLTQVLTNIYVMEWEQDLIQHQLQHHEVYGRTKILKLLLSKLSPKAGIPNSMTIDGQLDFISQAFNTILYTSTTYRQPRNIRLFKKFKGNEFRIFLLIGYSIFGNVLSGEWYVHLKVLAFIARLVEGEYLFVNAYERVRSLAAFFDEEFASLYTVNQIIPMSYLQVFVLI
ncbi:unnamed protein product [Adineta steineri]|uniref:Uncharacterized protein n=1 Tax=Adineta steineri TaxID=433720 RepID=A0A819HZD8_9BILA|nr:unnamed protein product [Adineta steineri]CAF3905096.1 unnamed protein product [Adineta steineri]